MDQELLLAKVNRALKLKRPASGKITAIANELQQFIRKSAKPARRNMSIPQAFSLAIGETLAQNCRIESIQGGILRLRVSPGPYMYALQMQSSRIIEKLQTQCPSSGIREIKLLCLK
jgi:predicted nucleic acid-binding Zn ribbon protein